MKYSKSERLSEFYRRLSALPAAGNAQEARDQLTSTLNEVENEMTSIPYDPDNWKTDGRLYPPQDDALRSVPGRSDIIRYRHVAHNTFFGSNGSIEIQSVKGKVLFKKSGKDGKGVWDQ